MKDEKILDEEILTDEELEKVAGGTGMECLYDEQLLMKFELMGKWEHGHIRTGWKRLGIKLETDFHKKVNVYIDLSNGREISRKDALIRAMKQRGWNDVAIACFDEWEKYGIYK